MGVVYEAEQLSLGRRVAVKVLPAQNLTEADALERFRRESRVAARLHHTNIVPVYEVGQEGDICFYAMTARMLPTNTAKKSSTRERPRRSR